MKRPAAAGRFSWERKETIANASVLASRQQQAYRTVGVLGSANTEGE